MLLINLNILIIAASLASPFVYAGGADLHGHETQHQEEDLAGDPGLSKGVDREITVTMHDSMRFNLDQLLVKQGETIRFVIYNQGKIPHEFTIGDKETLLDHRDMMRKMPQMKHQEANAITLEPGEKSEIIWTFGKGDNIQVACLIPGHYEAGMYTRVTITK